MHKGQKIFLTGIAKDKSYHSKLYPPPKNATSLKVALSYDFIDWWKSQIHFYKVSSDKPDFTKEKININPKKEPKSSTVIIHST